MADVERIVVPLKDGFDLSKHRAALEAQVAKVRGDGWRLRNVDSAGKRAVFEREVSVTQVAQSEEKVTLRLAPDLAKPSAGDIVAAQYQDRYPGFYLTKFDPYLQRAEMTRLTEGAVRTRGALAVALGCKPWDIQIATQNDGGYEIGLPGSYMPSKHDTKLEEVTVTVAGRVGWRIEIDAANLRARMIPGEPPLFPAAVAYPLAELGPKGDKDRSLIGVTLPIEGEGIGERVYIDWTDAAFGLAGGLPGSGKFFAHDTPVPVPISEKFPDGWARHGDLEPGDWVFATDGSVAPITDLSDEQISDTYRLVTDDGQSFIVGDDHLWKVVDDSIRIEVDPITDEEAAKLDDLARTLCTHKAGATLTNLADLIGCDEDVLLAVLEASGSLFVSNRYGERVYVADEAVRAYRERCTSQVAQRIVSTRQMAEQMPNEGYRILPACAIDLPDVDLETDPRDLGASVARGDVLVIPASYLRSSIDQRRAVLSGLRDVSDDLVFDRSESADSVLELVRSLGMTATIDLDENGRTRVDVRSESAGEIRVTSIEPVDPVPARCIRIDHPDHLYLVGGFVPTHNTVLLNSLVAHQVSSGAQLVIVDDSSKAVDFEWCKQYVRPGGWGCDSEKHAVAVLAMVYEEGQKRAKRLKELGINNWLDMPAGERFDPIFIVVDELSALLVLDPVPKGVSKDNPIVVEINELNYMKQLIGRFINKIIAEQRFVGVRMVLSTQITNAATGLPPSTKGKIGHRILQGNNPSKAQRDQMFNDERSVPSVPPHVQSSGKHARGVGVADLEGQAPVVYKSLFASVGDYRKRFDALGLPTTNQPEPTAEQIAKYVPALDDEAVEVRKFDTPSGKPLDPKFGPLETFDADGNKLFGAAAAAAASKKLSDTAASEPNAKASKPGPKCPACGLPINDGCTC